MPSFSTVPIQKVKDYWDERPCNIRHSPSEFGSQRYFDEVEQRKYLVEPHIPGFAEFDRWKGRKVLEIGCGIGTDTINFARAGAQVTAVELSTESLEIARRRAKVLGLSDRIDFRLANAQELSSFILPQQYDLVYSFGVIHHTPKPECVIEEIAKHFVGRGSTVKLMVYNRFSWKVLWILLTNGKGAFWKLDHLIARNSEAQTGSPITYAYSRAGLRRLLGEAFDIKEIRVEHIFPYRISDYVNYRYAKVWYFRYIPAPLFRWIERRLGWHLCVTAVAK